MNLRVLVAAGALLVVSPSAGAVEPAAALADVPAVSASDLMGRYGLNAVFSDFGRTIAASPRLSGISDEHFLAAWEETAVEAFARPELRAELAERLSAGLAPAELADVGAFTASTFGTRIGALEIEAQSAPPDLQVALIARGQALYLGLSPERRARIDEVMALTGADVMFSTLRESIRGMALALRLSAGGDLSQSWADIDAGITRELAGMRESLAEATRGLLAYAYAPLSDEEIEAYLAFLRTPAARRFYAVTGEAIGAILERTMIELGREVADRLERVDI